MNTLSTSCEKSTNFTFETNFCLHPRKNAYEQNAVWYFETYPIDSYRLHFCLGVMEDVIKANQVFFPSFILTVSSSCKNFDKSELQTPNKMHWSDFSKVQVHICLLSFSAQMTSTWKIADFKEKIRNTKGSVAQISPLWVQSNKKKSF